MLELKWQNTADLNRLANAMGRLNGGQRHLALQRAVNHTGTIAKNVVKQALVKQTGLSPRAIEKALKVSRASGAFLDKSTGEAIAIQGGNIVYAITTSGGDISLKYFRKRETTKGVVATVFGKQKLYPGSFIKGGRFPNRKSAKSLGGHVYERTGSIIKATRGKSEGKKVSQIRLLDSGVVIPAEMLKGAAAAAFQRTVNERLPNRVMHEINHLCPGIFL